MYQSFCCFLGNWGKKLFFLLLQVWIFFLPYLPSFQALDIENVRCRLLVAIRQAQLPADFSGVLPGSTCSSDFGPETFFLQTMLPVTVLYFMVCFLGSVAGINELCVAPRTCSTGSDLHLLFAVSQHGLILHASDMYHKFIVWREDVFSGFWCSLAGWRDVVK